MNNPSERALKKVVIIYGEKSKTTGIVPATIKYAGDGGILIAITCEKYAQIIANAFEAEAEPNSLSDEDILVLTKNYIANRVSTSKFGLTNLKIAKMRSDFIAGARAARLALKGDE